MRRRVASKFARDGLVGDPVPVRDFVLGNAVLWQRDELVGIFAVRGAFDFVCGQRHELRVLAGKHTPARRQCQSIALVME